MRFVCKTESDLLPAAQQLLSGYPGRRVFAFYGPLGAGKTTFIKVICHLLGAADIVQSPTFALVNEYKTPAGESLFHLDFYRIRKLEEVFDIGYEDYVFSGDYCFIEWPELVEDLLPEETVRVRISGENARVIEI
ncbi:MAG TPA: tRNA (adenosine(37)-N6)-threonylcarbamoyltransferase complex ATPase subunit type 1 TsaE [Bacteroidales bacterium]|nr:tRNA (adenosine(37)-N6)-threonylcarbamoyltransferase complex ATPase subunit type 1 TsaE [Bacteroidales bacterium]